MQTRSELGVAIALDGSGATLEGLLAAGAKGAGGALIAPPHPLYGGTIESPVVQEMAQGCRQSGLATLCFNWRGVGASAGQPSGDVGAAEADYAAALRHLEQLASAPIIACGYSYGAAIAVRAARGNPAVGRLVLVAPPPSMLDANDPIAFDGPSLVIAGGADAISPAAPLGELTAPMPRAHFEVIPHADHFFARGQAEISRIISSWLTSSARTA
jgi:alpha/beta superfamily hydrolase